LVDGRGGLRAATSLYLQPLKNGRMAHLKLASQQDCEQLYKWQIEPTTRKYALNPSTPSWLEHQQWFKQRTSAYNHQLYVITCLGSSLGMVRLDPLAEPNTYQVSIVTAPNHKRLGVAKAALMLIRMVIPQATFKATILPANTASQSLFFQQGYHSIGNNRYIQVAGGTQ
jgi:hypothetical protein